MGSFKPLIKYKEKTFLLTILEKLYSVCEKIGIVTGFKNNEIENTVNELFSNSELNRNKIHLFYNPNFKSGMFSSLQTGLKAMSDCDWLLYHFVDQPHLPPNFYPEFIKQIEIGYNWIQPEYNRKNGHPILINKSMFPKILDSSQNSLKDMSQSGQIKKKIWTCNYKQIAEDIDTKDDYQKLI